MRLFIRRTVDADWVGGSRKFQPGDPTPPDLPWWYSRAAVLIRPTPSTTSDAYRLAYTFTYAPWGLGWLAPLVIFPRPWEGRLLIWLYTHGFLAVPDGTYDLRWSQLRFPRRLS